MSDYIIVDGELKHYGVIGMKWGMRRARKKGTTYQYRSHATNVYAKKAAKARKKGNIAKAKQYETYTKKSQELDSKMQAYAKKVSTGKAIAQALLINSRSYAAAKAATGGSRIAGTAASRLGGFGDQATRRMYVRGYDSNKIARRLTGAALIANRMDREDERKKKRGD